MPWQPWMRTLKEALTVLRRGSSQLQRPASLPQHTGSASGVARVSATAGGGVACPSVSENEGDSSYSQMQLLGGQNSADADAEQPTPCQVCAL